MSIKKIALALALSIAGGTVAAASQFDGDNNPIPGTGIELHGVFANTFASARVYAAQNRVGAASMTKKAEIDGDGNPIPGVN